MSTSTDIATNFAGGCLVEIVKAVGRQARYCYEFKKFVEDLDGGHENLKATRYGIQRQFDRYKANTKEPSRDLQLQLEKANELVDKVEKLREKAKAKKICCPYGLYPNWICRYFVGKKAEEKTIAMKQLNDELRQKLLPAHRLSLRSRPLSKDFILFKCTTKARDEILKALRDDKKIRIGLNGMGGCGKSCLLRLVHKEVEDLKLFKTAFVEVSNPPDRIAIQDSIANWIGLKFETEKSVFDRAARLSMAFQKDKKYLIILDNVWQVLDFEAMGIPVGENCKVLLSSRKRHIFDVMKFDPVTDLSLLTKEEAWELFQKHVDEINETLQQVAREITDECHRLPVAIKAVASTLRGKNFFAWSEARKTLKDLRQPIDIEQGLDDPYRCLKYSLDELKDLEEESLYLLCALFPNGCEIAIEDLIRFAFGLSIFQDVDSYEGARSKVCTTIDKFKNCCLLLQVQEGHNVKLHDMFRSLALWEAKNRQIVSLREANHLNRLYCQCIEEFPDQSIGPELEILIMSDSGSGYSSKLPDMFFVEMMKLKVLAIKNISIGTKPDLVLPRSIEGLKKLRTLHLGGWRLTNICLFEKLEMLDTIELLDCIMEELPKELDKMEALKLLEVSRCKIGGNPYKVLATCSHLEELYFVDNDFPEMVQLIGQNVAEFLYQIGSSEVLKRYRLGIGGSINTSKDHSSSQLISMNNIDASSITNEAFQALSRTLEVLFFEKIQGDCKSIIPDMFPIQGECLKELKEFVLHDSNCIKSLIDTTNDQRYDTRILFSKLQKLKVEAMEGLEALCHGPPPCCLFERLKELVISSCSQLASLFTAAIARKMVKLEVLEVIDCVKMRHMIKVEHENEDISVEPVLPNLKKISVKRCKNLECILPISFASVLLQLESLEVEDAAKLLYVFGKDNHDKDQKKNHISIDLSAVKVFKLIDLPIIISICPQNYGIKLPLDKVVVRGCPKLSGIDLLMPKLEDTPVHTESSTADLQQQQQVPRRARKIIGGKVFSWCCNGGNRLEIGDYYEGFLSEEEVFFCINEVLLSNEITCHPNFCMFESTRRSCDEIQVALDDDEIYMIGLCGMEGCGKTTLIQQVCDKLKILGFLDMVAFVEVSHPPDIRRIQGDIARQLGFAFNFDENETERAATLSMKLNDGHDFLIVLDDIWQVLNLEEVGIPLGRNCKVVLTTRLQEICFLMDCQKMVYLSILTEQESWILFQEHAGTIQDSLKDLAQQISGQCEGLPRSIIEAARTLKDKPEHETTSLSLSSQEYEIVETQDGLQKHRFCPVDPLNLRQSCTEIGDGILHEDATLEETTMGTSSEEYLTFKLEPINLEKPKTMDDSKRKKLEYLCPELKPFRYDKEWLASIAPKSDRKQADHTEKLKQLVQLKYDASSLEDQLDDARTRMDSVEHDLSKLDNMFGLYV